MHLRAVVAVAFLVLAAPVARAETQIQTQGPESFPGKSEFSAHLGYQAGFGAKYGTPTGFKLFAEYAYRFHEIVWFDVQLNQVFGFANGACIGPGNNVYSCGNPGGWGTSLLGGVKLKFKLKPVPIVIEVPLTAGVDFLYNRDCGDNGMALPIFRAGAGAKYFLTRSIGVGVQFGFAFGPAFHFASNCYPYTSYADFYGTFDAGIGAEFVF